MKTDTTAESLMWASNSFLLDSLFEQSPLGLFVVDDKFHFVKVSKYFAQQINRKTPEEHLGKSISQVLGRKDWQALKPYYLRALNGEYIHDVHIRGLTQNAPNEDRHFLLSLYQLPEVKKRKLIGGLVQEVTRQYEAEEELLSYQNRLEMAQNAGGVGVFEWDFNTSEVWSSPEEIELFELEQNESSETVEHWLNRIHPEDKDRILKLIESSSEEHRGFDTEFRIILPSNEIKWIRGKGKFFYDNKGQAVQLLGVNYDITKRKQEEQFLKFKADTSRLLTSSNYERALQQTCDLAVKYVADWCSIDILEGTSFRQEAISHKDPTKVTFAKELRKQYPSTLATNKALSQVVSTKKPLFIPVLTYEMLHPKDLPKKMERIIDELKLSSIMILPLIVQNKAFGALTFVLAESGGHYTDSDLEMAQQLALRTSLYIENIQLNDQIKNERIRLVKLFENVPCIVFESRGDIDDPDYTMTFINSYAEELLGYTVKKWLTTPKFGQSIIHPEDKERVLTETRKFVQDKTSGLLRFRWKAKSGKYIWVEIRFTPILDMQENVVGLRGVANDITERMRLEQRKDDFIATASHELKTPLTSLKVFSQVLKQNPIIRENAKLDQYVSRMEREVDRLTELVFDLLDLSKIQRGQLGLEKKNFPIEDLLEEIISSVQPTVKQKLLFKPKGKTILHADRPRLNQVFSNLINNAVKYSPDSDKVIIKAKQEKDMIVVSVQDFGIGISPEYQNQVFQRFYRVFDEKDKTFPGLGMGLFISKTIVERHKGQIWVESTPTEGSTFFVGLPMKHSGRESHEVGANH